MKEEIERMTVKENSNILIIYNRYSDADVLIDNGYDIKDNVYVLNDTIYKDSNVDLVHLYDITSDIMSNDYHVVICNKLVLNVGNLTFVLPTLDKYEGDIFNDMVFTLIDKRGKFTVEEIN